MMTSGAAAQCATDPLCGVFAPDPINSSSVMLSACAFMYCNQSYSDSGIPCGFGTEGVSECAGVAPISFANEDFSQAQLDALVVDLGQNTLINGVVVGAGLFGNDADQHLEILQPTTINVTFLTEGACFQNVLGMITWPTDAGSNSPPLSYPRDPRSWSFADREEVLSVAKVSIIYINADDAFCNDQDGLSGGISCAPAEPAFCRTTSPNLETGTTMRLIPDAATAPDELVFAAGTSVSFFIVPDGFTSDLRSGTFGDDPGEDLTDLLFAVSTLNDPALASLSDELGSDLRQHSVVFSGPADVLGADFSREIIFSFEDKKRGPFDPRSNLDFDDLTFLVDLAPGSIPPPPPPPRATEEPTAAPTPAPGGPGLCAAGLVSDCGNVCCDAACGSCGGCDCAR
ncbi:MAG: DUF4114 domain-containing protein [Planctomycetota bacterium]